MIWHSTPWDSESAQSLDRKSVQSVAPVSEREGSSLELVKFAREQLHRASGNAENSVREREWGMEHSGKRSSVSFRMPEGAESG